MGKIKAHQGDLTLPGGDGADAQALRDEGERVNEVKWGSD